ncbi:MAG: ECF-type sigma factor [Gammaproteobacteria bacterium]
MAEEQAQHITALLTQIRRGERQASDELLPIVYDELRKLARARMAREPGQTLQATALVHEAYLRLVADADPRWENRAHFFAAAAEAMRRILVERARRRARVRHGGGQVRATLSDSVAVSGEDAVDVVAVDQALTRLREMDDQLAQLVTLRYFGGLDVEEAAAVMNLSPRSVNRLWTAARAWLQVELRG